MWSAGAVFIGAVFIGGVNLNPLNQDDFATIAGKADTGVITNAKTNAIINVL